MLSIGIAAEKSPMAPFRLVRLYRHLQAFMDIQGAMRRAGHNPTDIEVMDIINKIDNDTGGLDFQVNPLDNTK